MTDIWHNCRLCDEELTFEEQVIIEKLKLEHECLNCLEQVAN